VIGVNNALPALARFSSAAADDVPENIEFECNGGAIAVPRRAGNRLQLATDFVINLPGCWTRGASATCNSIQSLIPQIHT
jgi:hypothetical protein